ncbi:MAG: Ig-like domain-containing protein [SAR324 cluster bacterium]|nr:Ig-like domain-containing protein [SAR324 cluster bacterium]
MRSAQNYFLLLIGIITIIGILFSIPSCGGGGDNGESKSSTTSDTSTDLPPDPGEVGKQTIEGVDSDNDGVRDDIQRYIAMNYSDEPTQNALTEYAKQQQTMLLSSQSEEGVLNATNELMETIDSLFSIDSDSAGKKAYDIRSNFMNTKERVEAYLKAEALLSGKTFLLEENSTTSRTSDENQCIPEIMIYFGNGMNNSSLDAMVNMEVLKKRLDSVLPEDNNITPRYGFSYNQKEDALAQLLEVGNQEYHENYIDMFNWLAGIDAAPDWFQEEMEKIAANINKISYLNDTDLQKHVTKYKADILEGKRVIVVSHSQGNFYANRAYESVASDSMGIVSVATPANYVAGGGNYTTLTNDLIMNAVREVIDSDTLPANATNTNSGESSGHKFVESYLDGDVTGPRIIGHIQDMYIGFIPLPSELCSRITGKTLNKTTGEAIPGVTIELWDNDDTEMVASDNSDQYDASYELVVPPGNYILKAQHSSYEEYKDSASLSYDPAYDDSPPSLEKNIMLVPLETETIFPTTVTPRWYETNVPITTPIIGIFDEELNFITVLTDQYDAIIVGKFESNGTDLSMISGNVELSDDNKTIQFTPDSDLEYDTTYEVLFHSEVKTVSGKLIDPTIEWQFTTVTTTTTTSTTSTTTTTTTTTTSTSTTTTTSTSTTTTTLCSGNTVKTVDLGGGDTAWYYEDCSGSKVLPSGPYYYYNTGDGVSCISSASPYPYVDRGLCNQ